MKEFLSTELLNNTVEQWLIALGVILLVFVFLLILRYLLNSKVRKLVEKTNLSIDNFFLDLIYNTKRWFLFFVAFAVGILFLEMDPQWDSVIRVAMTVGFTFQIASWAVTTSKYFISEQIKKEKSGSKVTIYNTVGIFSRVLIWIFAGLVILDSIPNVEISSLVTGLGIGGIAIGLAVQSILEDLFASVSITADQPFAIGDFIEVNDKVGVVENIGMKSTRLRALSGEQIVIGNAAITSNEIRNYQKLEQRRVTISVGVTYETPYALLEKIPSLLKEIVSSQENVRFDRVHFDEMAASSLDFLLVYYVESSDFLVHMNAKQAINFAVIKKFEEEGIDIAYPTQTLYIPKN